MNELIKITFPDGNIKEFPSGINGIDIAKSISSRLAKEVIAVSVNAEIWDAMRPINFDTTIKLHTWNDDEGKHAFWHSSAHLMAEVLEHFEINSCFISWRRFGPRPNIAYESNLNRYLLTEYYLSQVVQRTIKK